jgi:hypothetical protein
MKTLDRLHVLRYNALTVLLLMAVVGVCSTAKAQTVSPVKENQRAYAYGNTVKSPRNWFSAYRTDAGYIVDPIGELAACPKALVDELSELYSTSSGALQNGLRHHWVHSVKRPQLLRQQAALARIQSQPLWMVDEKGARAIQLKHLLAKYNETYAPCVHLSNFPVTEPTRVNIPDWAEVLVSAKELPSGARIVRAKNRAHNAFNERPSTDSGTTSHERSVAAWAVEQSSLMRAFEKDVPKPEPKERYQLCVPSFQSFNASLDGQLRNMLSLRLQWCECLQASPDASAGQCTRFKYPYNNKQHWLAIVERRGSWMGDIWASSLQAGDAIQFMLVEGVVTQAGSRDDMIWIKDIHYEGISTSLMQRVPKTTKLRSTTISTYSGL